MDANDTTKQCRGTGTLESSLTRIRIIKENLIRSTAVMELPGASSEEAIQKDCDLIDAELYMLRAELKKIDSTDADFPAKLSSLEDSIDELVIATNRFKTIRQQTLDGSAPSGTNPASNTPQFGVATITRGSSRKSYSTSFLSIVSVFLPPATREDITDVIADLNRTGREMESKGWSHRRVSIVITTMSLRSLLGVLRCFLKEHASKALPFRLRL